MTPRPAPNPATFGRIVTDSFAEYLVADNLAGTVKPSHENTPDNPTNDVTFQHVAFRVQLAESIPTPFVMFDGWTPPGENEPQQPEFTVFINSKSTTAETVQQLITRHIASLTCGDENPQIREWLASKPRLDNKPRLNNQQHITG